MNKRIEDNENVEPPLYLPSHSESLKEKHELFEVPDLGTKLQRHDNPHYWVQQDILQIKQFQYRLFQSIILNEDTVTQFETLSECLLKFLRFNYQLLWEQLDQDAYINFPQILTEVELLQFEIVERNKHSHCRDLTSFSTNYFDLIKFDNDFRIENSETSDKRPYTTSTSFEESDHEISQLNPDNNKQISQNQEPQQLNIVLHYKTYQIFLILLQFKMFQNSLIQTQITHNVLQ